MLNFPICTSMAPVEISKNNNMGLVRYYLALMVIISHFNLTFETDLYLPTSSYNAVGGFFALSGFLVYKSWLGSGGMKPYMLRRARRILPPYLFVVLLSAFGLVAVSTLSWHDYFFSSEWIRYVAGNLVFLNFLAPELPGVFQDLPIHAVNGSLWTIKIEIMLYLSIPVFAWMLTLIHRRFGKKLWSTVALIVLIYVFSMAYRLIFSHLYLSTGKEIYNIMSRQVFGQLMYFYVGVLIYFIYDFFMKHRLAILCAVVILMIVAHDIPDYTIILGPVVVSVSVLLVSFIGNVRFLWMFNRNNVSYDMYLMHFPVLLVLRQTGVLAGYPEVVQFAIALCAVMMLSCFSWFVIGKRFLVRNKRAVLCSGEVGRYV